jgi:hypothetical protein
MGALRVETPSRLLGSENGTPKGPLSNKGIERAKARKGALCPETSSITEPTSGASSVRLEEVSVRNLFLAIPFVAVGACQQATPTGTNGIGRKDRLGDGSEANRTLEVEPVCLLKSPDELIFRSVVVTKTRPVSPVAIQSNKQAGLGTDWSTRRTLWQIHCTADDGCVGFQLELDRWDRGETLSMLSSSVILPSAVSKQFHASRSVLTLQYGPWRTFTFGLSDQTVRYSEVNDGFETLVAPIPCGP